MNKQPDQEYLQGQLTGFRMLTDAFIKVLVNSNADRVTLAVLINAAISDTIDARPGLPWAFREASWRLSKTLLAKYSSNDPNDSGTSITRFITSLRAIDAAAYSGKISLLRSRVLSP